MQNQERAYIAASRRTDRSLEARYQSALMASAIHKKRTGKGFRVTHEIVQSEDMYEEEEGLLESTTSLNAYRGRTWSQTDAYIAALIARKSGMHVFGYGNALPDIQFQSYAAQANRRHWHQLTTPFQDNNHRLNNQYHSRYNNRLDTKPPVTILTTFPG